MSMASTPTHPGAELRSFTIGKVLGDSFYVLKQHFFKIWLIGLLPTTVMLWPLLFLPVSREDGSINNEETIEFFRTFSIVFPSIMIVAVILTLIVFAVITTGTVQALATGNFDLKRAIGLSVRRLIPLFVVGLLSVFGVLIGFILLVIPGIYLILRWWFAAVVAVVEQRGPFDSMARSAELTRDRKWNIFGLFLISILISVIVSLLFDAVLAALVSLTAMPPAVSIVLSVVLDSVVSGYWAVLPGVAYYWLRMEKDGPDTESLAQVFA